MLQEKAPASKRSKALSMNAFFGIQIVAAVLLIALLAPQFEGNLLALAFFGSLNVVAQLMPIHVYRESSISMGFVVTLAVIILFGVPGIVIMAPLAAIAMRIGMRKLDYLAITNGARWVVVYSGAALAYDVFGETGPDTLRAGSFIGAGVATAVSFGLSVILVMISTRLRTGQSLVETWARNNWVGVHYAAMGVLGLVLAAAYIALGVLGVLAFVTPAIMMRFATKQYVDKTEENVEKLEQQNKALTQANIHIQRISDELRVSYDGTLEALVNALDARDQETKGHSLRVSRYMLDIAREMGVQEGTQQWIDMQRGSLLHDVGKIGVADGILLKPAKLTEDEWVVMRRHPEIGYNMLNQVQFLQGAAEIILSHHERWDGAGYPRGLAHEEIPFGARIFMVCDTFDSMTSDRPYRKALSTQVALEEILKYSGSQFDPRVVEAFLDIYDMWVRERNDLHGSGLSAAA